ncbi:MAG: DUF4038 domain-containing protein [bacterium]
MQTVAWALCVVAVRLSGATNAGHFSADQGHAVRFGVHQVSLAGSGAVTNPFDTRATVTFTPPSGAASAKAVQMFYDGAEVWRARVYVTETGTWHWVSASAGDALLSGRSGSFIAQASPLRGMLKKHPDNPRALMTDDGCGFLNIADTAYYLFEADATPWQKYAADNWRQGVTLMRCSLLGALRKGERFFDGSPDLLNLANFQRSDARLRWLLDNYPGLYVELILFAEPNTGYNKDETFWAGLSAARRERLLRNLVARYGAFPQVVWEIVNDYAYGPRFPNNMAMAHEVGAYLARNDPWRHLVTTGPIRGGAFCFTDAGWATLCHLETLDALDADQTADYAANALHVFCGEDRYETYKPPAHPDCYFRRLMWAWLLSGGSACYGGDWDAVVSYSESGLHGLDGVRHIKPFFETRNLDIARYVPDDALAVDPDGKAGAGRPQLARCGTSSYLLYLPNADGDGQVANVHTGVTARVRVDLSRASGTYVAEWLRSRDGASQDGGKVSGGAWREFTAPWQGEDVVLRLTAAP